MSTKANDGDIERDSFEKRLHRLAESDEHSDCEFIVGSEKKIIKGHKLLFSAASEVFDAMFYGLLKEDKPVAIEDLTAEGFEGMKTFIYTGKVSFKSAKHALLTYIAARKYLVTLLGKVCTDFIVNNMKSSEVLEFCDICKLNCISEFEEDCTRIIQERTDEVVDSKYFIHSKPETIELILKSPALKLKSEIEVFEHFERWALAEVERKRINENEIACSFDNLKKHIRFFSIKGDEFASRVGESKLLTHEEKYAIAFNKLKLSSKPMPDSISYIEMPRNFNVLPTSIYHTTHVFRLSLIKTNSIAGPPIVGTCPKYGTSILTVSCDYACGFIFFKLTTNYYAIKAIFVIKSIIRILAVNKCDDLVIESEIKDFVNTSQSSQIQKTIYLAMIPVNKVNDDRFLKSNKVIDIKGTFKVERINPA
ncbi:uncharacterized protein LOC111058878 isoform X2 [Nilaparvata lugens]|nr:uncharacterized protein LOC111058878 isoform X2 [Nilaparvata lugens]XP_039289389.1 uncharacterized protein LOC111058878 isoform X2 [Nilaparvata lugens]